MNGKFETENVATTNKLLASFLRYRGFIFTLSNGNKNPNIATFNFENVPRYVIEEYRSGSPDITRFRDIYNVREIVNQQLREFWRKHNEKSIPAG